MDELKVGSRFLKQLIGTILSRQLTRKLGAPISLALYDLNIVEDVDNVERYSIHVKCNIWVSKEDLKKLIWNDQNGSGTS